MKNRTLLNAFNEQRVGKRRAVKWEAAIKRKKDKTSTPAVTLNISSYGVLLESPSLLKVGEKPPLMIVVDYRNFHFALYAKGIVRHATTKDLDCYIGIEFLKLNITHRNFLIRFTKGLI
ncbi:PilZ domain-containing protein [Spartinivicinus poritis]|uniref:PilZ domain-containing protein n=1 Tax=Spartinivicinus poritis TaxID=2994640 RepID=A0ABT5UFP0_9GAMM|nr:PilZ domain-containing protein [Spartinivicinus sp. A2-2]MDE1465204.1 PilZ domain-containing protein [Spartinivicinus sp. A2-2]